MRQVTVLDDHTVVAWDEPAGDLSGAHGARPDEHGRAERYHPHHARPRRPERGRFAVPAGRFMIVAVSGGMVAAFAMTTAILPVVQAADQRADYSLTVVAARPAPAGPAHRRPPAPDGSDGPDGADEQPARPPSPQRADPPVRETRLPPVDALNVMRGIVAHGVQSNEIRPDVGLDLNNVLIKLQRRLVAGGPVRLEHRIADLRTKIETRLREGGLTQGRAEQLERALPQV